jgi:hypothetical protein
VSIKAGTELDLLRQKVDDLQNSLNFDLELFAGLVALLTLVPMFITAAQNRPIAHLFMAGEQSRQKHEEDIFGALFAPTQTTISLVNQTLTLAKEASERAAKAMEQRAKAEMDILDRAARALVAFATAGDDRALIKTPKRQTEVESLALKVNAFETYRVLLNNAIEITPACLFIKATNAHLMAHYEDAREIWRDVGNNTEAEATLRSLAWYWSAYESNNLGEFDQAKLGFTQANEFAKGDRQFELRRISIETDFFNYKQSKANEIVAAIDHLLADAQRENVSAKILDAIRGTAGNIHYVQGRNLRDAANEDKARQSFARAREIYESNDSPGKWSALGAAQCCLALNVDVEAARKLMADRVFVDVGLEFRDRAELRTKALAIYAQIICCLANPELAGKREDWPTIGQLTQTLRTTVASIDERLTVYSLRQRRNVNRDEFEKDVAATVQEGTGA